MRELLNLVLSRYCELLGQNYEILFSRPIILIPRLCFHGMESRPAFQNKDFQSIAIPERWSVRTQGKRGGGLFVFSPTRAKGQTPTSYTVKFQTYSKTFLNVFTLILFWRIEMIPHLRGYADLGLKMRFSFFVLS